jgi:hypothetical protein
MSFAMLNLILLFGFSGILIFVIVFIQRLIDSQKVLQQRAVLREQVLQLRLYKMLIYLGVDFKRYISVMPRDTILKHVSNCSACPNITTCDRCLFNGKVISDMDFCPNYQPLISCSRKLAQVS